MSYWKYDEKENVVGTQIVFNILYSDYNTIGTQFMYDLLMFQLPSSYKYPVKRHCVILNLHRIL